MESVWKFLSQRNTAALRLDLIFGVYQTEWNKYPTLGYVINTND